MYVRRPPGNALSFVLCPRIRSFSVHIRGVWQEVCCFQSRQDDAPVPRRCTFSYQVTCVLSTSPPGMSKVRPVSSLRHRSQEPRLPSVPLRSRLPRGGWSPRLQWGTPPAPAAHPRPSPVACNCSPAPHSHLLGSPPKLSYEPLLLDLPPGTQMQTDSCTSHYLLDMLWVFLYVDHEHWCFQGPSAAVPLDLYSVVTAWLCGSGGSSAWTPAFCCHCISASSWQRLSPSLGPQIPDFCDLD